MSKLNIFKNPSRQYLSDWLNLTRPPVRYYPEVDNEKIIHLDSTWTIKYHKNLHNFMQIIKSWDHPKRENHSIREAQNESDKILFNRITRFSQRILKGYKIQ